MAHFYRLIACVLFLWSGAAHALVSQAVQYYNVVPYYYDTPAAFCASYVAYIEPAQQQQTGKVHKYTVVNCAAPLTTPGSSTASGTYVYYTNGVASNPLSWSVGFNSRYAGCPAHSVSVSGGCQCDAGYVENSAHTACEPPADPCLAIKGAIYGEIEWDSTLKGNNYGCLGGEGQLASCQTVAVCDYTSQVPGQSGYTCRGNSYATGTRSVMCSGTGETPDSPSKPPTTDPVNPDKPPVPGQPAPARCPVGQAPGTFNGTRICAPIGPDTQTGSLAPGSGSTTTNNSDGSSTTSTTTGTTTCLQGKCTTSTVNTNVTINAPGNETCPAGQTSGTTTVNGQSRTTCTATASGSTSQAQTDFCKQNPKDKQCGGDGADTSFGGTCAAGFKAVSDDAVLNAMAEEQYRRNCQVFATDKPESTVVADASDPTGLLKATTPGDSTVSVGSGNFDTSSSLGGGSCNLNKTIVVAKMTATLPFNVICDPLAYLGEVLVAVSLLLAARIVARG